MDLIYILYILDFNGKINPEDNKRKSLKIKYKLNGY